MKTSLKSLMLAAGLVAASAAAAHAAEKVRFVLDWLPAGDKGGIYYAIQKGYFEKAGLDVTISVGRGSSDAVTKIATGAADIGYGGLSALLQAAATDHVPVKAVATIYTSQPDAIFTTEGSGIEKLSDLVGKKVATATFSSSNVVWPLLLEANNIKPDSIQLLKVDPGALAPMLATGQVDATINWLTVVPTFLGPLKEAGKTLKTLPWSDYGFNGYGLSMFASDAMIKDRPDVLAKFLAAYKEANIAAIADPDGVAAALKAMVPEADEAVAKAQWVASIPLMDNATTKKDGVGAFNPDLLKETWKWVAKAQNLAMDSLDPESIVSAVKMQ